MKKILLINLYVVLALFIITGCESTNKNVSNHFKIKDTELIFDKDSEFHNFIYKNIEGIEPDESKQAVYLDYVNKDIYDGRFVFRIGMAFSNETTLKEFIGERKADDIKINSINWKRLIVKNTTDKKETTSIIYATEKDSYIYVVSTIIFDESNVDLNKLSEMFIHGVKLK